MCVGDIYIPIEKITPIPHTNYNLLFLTVN